MTNDTNDFAILHDDPNEYQYEHLFEPTSIGYVDVRNRLTMTGHTTNYTRGRPRKAPGRKAVVNKVEK